MIFGPVIYRLPGPGLLAAYSVLCTLNTSLTWMLCQPV